MQEHDYSEEIHDDGQAVIRKRTRQLKVYLSDSEFARFQQLQAETSLSAAGLIRRWITGQQVRSTVDLQAVNEMRRQGGLFKNNAWALGNRGKLSKADVDILVGIANDIHDIAKEIRRGFEEDSQDR